MNRLRRLLKNHREIILYIFFGGCTTVLNYIVYALCFGLFSIDYIISNIIACFIAILFAYFTNRSMVFNSRAAGIKNIVKEMLMFFGSRIFSLVVETLLLFVFVQIFAMNEYIAKFILAIVTVVLNYITGKLVVFRKKEKRKDS